MKVSQAALYGGVSGFLIGLSVCFLREMSLVDAFYRIFILCLAGAWMGVLFFWLDQLLPEAPESFDNPGKKDAHG